jgi:positive phototaxis protein PixI
MEGDKLQSISNDRSNRSPSLDESTVRTQQQFLRFSIQPNLMALIELDARSSSLDDGVGMRCQVTELVNIPLDRVVPMPHLPPAVMGVYNWRGEILWIVDLAVLVGTASPTRRYRFLQPTIILTDAEDLDVGGSSRLRTSQLTTARENRQARSIGLIVDEIAEIEWYELDPIRAPEPTDLIPAELLGWVRGVMESTTGDNFPVLDGQAIFARADIHADV